MPAIRGQGSRLGRNTVRRSVVLVYKCGNPVAPEYPHVCQALALDVAYVAARTRRPTDLDRLVSAQVGPTLYCRQLTPILRVEGLLAPEHWLACGAAQLEFASGLSSIDVRKPKRTSAQELGSQTNVKRNAMSR
jgi:hypothetical protein